jgi:hypothetical protein
MALGRCVVSAFLFARGRRGLGRLWGPAAAELAWPPDLERAPGLGGFFRRPCFQVEVEQRDPEGDVRDEQREDK